MSFATLVDLGIMTFGLCDTVAKLPFLVEKGQKQVCNRSTFHSNLDGRVPFCDALRAGHT